MLAGLADANGDPTDPRGSFDSFFNETEYFTHAEFGWIPSYKQRSTDNVHLTAWHIDARDKDGLPSGWGLAFSMNRLLAERWEPFIRAGYSQDGGALWDRSVSIGCGYHISKDGGLLGLGLNWGRPSKSSFASELNEQYTAELFYRLHLLPSVTITPDIQLLIDPALNQKKNVVGIFGLRMRVTF
jgi:porin